MKCKVRIESKKTPMSKKKQNGANVQKETKRSRLYNYERGQNTARCHTWTRSVQVIMAKVLPVGLPVLTVKAPPAASNAPNTSRFRSGSPSTHTAIAYHYYESPECAHVSIKEVACHRTREDTGGVR